MHISPTLVLTLAIYAALLFLTVFVISLIITFRNRRIIQRHASPIPEDK